MTKREAYFFGNLATELEVFAFPRVGSHYFFYCLTGLFDLIAVNNEHFNNSEAIARQDEINESVLYQLDLREEGIPYQPLIVDPSATGVHGLPRIGAKPAIILVRDPLATLFSFFQVSRSRWGANEELMPWLRKEAAHYVAFYNRAFELIDAHPGRVLLVRYEDMRIDTAGELARIADYVGWPVAAEDIARAVADTRFETLSAAEDRHGFRERPNSARRFFRRGEAGGWRDALSASQVAALEAAHGAMMRRLGYLSEAAGP